MSPNYIPKVSVIVPVYNTERYVERAIISLMEQTLDDVQFIIIDDGSKDNSLNIIKQVIARYPARQGQVTLISRENRGVAATRAQGMELATGDYVIHLDSDDWAELNWLEALYTKAIEDNADVVICDYYKVYKNKKIEVSQNVLPSPYNCVKKLFNRKLSNSNWDKLVRKKIFDDNEISFIDGLDMGEDFLVTLLVLLNSKKISYINKPLYYYNKNNDSSLTKSYSNKTLYDLVKIVDLADNYMKEKGILEFFLHETNMFKLDVKSLIILNSNNNIDLVNYAFNLYPNTNKLIIGSNMKTLKFVYILRSLRLLSFYKYIVRFRILIKKIFNYTRST
ncbi:glycosyltransferase family 2 protein [Klebsiella quasipneumoniae]|uniref:glycosyltransferase family 2 protein n=1 Tax=Klebsiella quasipneumoniae TaxID=1463165 RepID=UPI00388F2F13